MDNENKFSKLPHGGYNPKEVDSYIQQLELEIQNYKLKSVDTSSLEVPMDFVQSFEAMQKELDNYHEIEDKLKEALQATHAATENIQQVVETEARKILYEANTNADEIVSQALEQSIIALNYIKKMRVDAKIFQKRFEILIQAQQDFATNNLWEEIFAPIEPYEFIDIESIKDINDIEEKE